MPENGRFQLHNCRLMPRLQRTQSAKWPFRVTQGHWFWYQSTAHMQLPISY